MTINEIFEIVKEQTGFDREQMQERKPARLTRSTPILFARYVVIILAHEEGFKPPQISPCFGLHRTAINYALLTISDLLTTNKQFKSMYLGCIERIARNEDLAA